MRMRKTLNVFCGVLCAASVVTAEIEVSDVLKIDGFVDMSATLDDGTFSSSDRPVFTSTEILFFSKIF